MSHVHIIAFEPGAPEGGRRTAYWEGELDWPSAPPAGARWVHCEDWGSELVAQVEFNGPHKGRGWITMEIRADAAVIQHLIDEHEFCVWKAPD